MEQQRIFCIKWIITTTQTIFYTIYPKQQQKKEKRSEWKNHRIERNKLIFEYYTYWQRESSQANILF